MNKLKHYRLLKGATQKDAAEAAGVQQSTYQRWERGSTEVPEKRLEKLAVFFGATPERLIGKPASLQSWVDQLNSDDSGFPSELTIHFKNNEMPLLFSVDAEALDAIFTAMMNKWEFCSFNTLSNQLVLLHLAAVSDVCTADDVLDEYGPEHDRYSKEYIGLPSDPREWEVIEALEFGGGALSRFNPELVESVKRKLIDLFEGNSCHSDIELDISIFNDKYFREKAVDLFKIANQIKLRFSNGIERIEFLEDDELVDLYENVLVFVNSPELISSKDFLRFKFEGGGKYSHINCSALDYIIFPRHKCEAAEVEHAESVENDHDD